MIFIETPIFTRRVKELMDDDDFAVLQKILVCNPSAGEVMEATGGIRKIRIAAKGHGKRGGSQGDLLPLRPCFADRVTDDISEK